MKVIYVAGKYSGENEYEVKKNIAVAEEHAVAIWKTKKAAAICPHLNTSHWGQLLTHQEFIDGDLAIMERCDGVLFLPNWRQSKGAKLEHNHAVLKGLPRLYSMGGVHDFLNQESDYVFYRE